MGLHAFLFVIHYLSGLSVVMMPTVGRPAATAACAPAFESSNARPMQRTALRGCDHAVISGPPALCLFKSAYDHEHLLHFRITLSSCDAEDAHALQIRPGVWLGMWQVLRQNLQHCTRLKKGENKKKNNRKKEREKTWRSRGNQRPRLSVSIIKSTLGLGALVTSTRGTPLASDLAAAAKEAIKNKRFLKTLYQREDKLFFLIKKNYHSSRRSRPGSGTRRAAASDRNSASFSAASSRYRSMAKPGTYSSG
jgi:hypothetical protein